MDYRRTDRRRTDPLHDDPECRAVFAIFWLAVASAWGTALLAVLR